MSHPSDPFGPAPDAESYVLNFQGHDPDPHWPTTDEWFYSQVDDGIAPELWGSYADRWTFTSVPSLSPAQETDAAFNQAVHNFLIERERGDV